MSKPIRSAKRPSRLRASARSYLEPAPLAAFFLGISSGFPFAMIGATLTTRLAQEGIDKQAITAFGLAILAYNLKWLWAWVVDGVALPGSARYGRRVTWLLLTGMLVIAAVFNLASVDPKADLMATAWAAILVGIAGATADIVIDAYRIELLSPDQLGVGSGMSQYGWRIGSAGAGGLALVIAAAAGWQPAYMACAAFALPAMLTGLVMGEPARYRAPSRKRGARDLLVSIVGPLRDFAGREGATLIVMFVIVYKIGDTVANLTFRLLFNDLGFSNGEIAFYDVGLGFWAYLFGIFIGGVLYARMGLKRSVLVSLWLMAVSNLSFAALALAGHSNLGMAGAIGFENVSSGIGGITVVAYLSALCDIRFTAAQYALLSAAASILGRFITGSSAGALIERIGYPGFYVLTTVIALPGIAIFRHMCRSGLAERSMGGNDNGHGDLA